MRRLPITFATRAGRCFLAVALLLILCGLPDLAHAQPTLHRVGPPGGTVTDLAITAVGPHIVYAAWVDHVTLENPSRLYRSRGPSPEDTRYVGSHGRDVSVHPVSPGIVFSGSSRSTDGGESWHGMEGVRQVLAFHPDDPDTIWARGDAALLVSRDAGATWALLAEIDLLSIAVSPATPTTLFGLTGSAVVRSDDDGATWSDVPFPGGEPLSVAVDAQNAQTVFVGSGQGLFRSADGGESWEVSLGQVVAIAVVIDPADSEKVYALAGPTDRVARVYASVDGGDTWDERSFGIRGAVRVLLIDPNHENRLYAGTWLWGVFMSEDAGLTWTSVGVTPAPFYPWFNFYNTSQAPISLDPGRANRMLVHPAHQGSLITEDGGATWGHVDYGSYDYVQAYATAFVSSDPSVVYAAARVVTYEPHDVIRRDEAVMKSYDGGISWTPLWLRNVGNDFFGLLAVSSHDPDMVTMNGHYLWRAILVTEDGGQTWRSTDYLGQAFSLLFVQKRPQMILASTTFVHIGPKVWQSRDLGITWTDITADLNTTGRLHVSSGEPPFAYLAPRVSGTSFFRSSVDEIDWQEVDMAPFLPKDEVVVRHVITAPDEPGRLFAAATSGLYTSEDDGNTWERLFEEPIHHLELDPHVPGRLWAASYFEGIYRIDGLQVSAQTGPPAAASFRLSAPFPNPTRSGVTIAVEAPAGDLVVAVYDLLGRRVAVLHDGPPAASGSLQLTWDLREEAGLAPSGTYVVVARVAGERMARVFTVAR